MAIDEASKVELRREALTSPHARDLIAALDAELLGRYPEEGTPRHFALSPDEVVDGEGMFLVGFVGQSAVGCGALRRVEGDSGELKRMYVVPSWRGRGMGRAILRALEEEGRRIGFSRLLLETGTRHLDALGLYEVEGYQATCAFGSYDDHPMSVFLAKDLVPR